MNRIIIIGNGFDLAHELPTKYNDFIDNYWKNVIIKLKDLEVNSLFKDSLIEIKNPTKDYDNNDYESLIKEIDNKYNIDKELDIKNFGSIKSKRIEINYLNKFFKSINKIRKIKNWVDIEEEYYSELIKIKSNVNTIFHDINELNNDFAEIKNLLIEYLKNIDEQSKKQLHNDLRIQNRIGRKIYFPILANNLNSVGLNHLVEIVINEIEKFEENPEKYISRYIVDIDNLLKKTNNSIKDQEIKKMLLSDNAINNFNLIPDNTLILTFNYTNTHYLYDRPKDFDTYYKEMFTNVKDIKIHGSINLSDKNPVIFGYGDELDDEYRSIEKLKNNDYLENIKSIIYSETDNYKKTIEFIDSDYYQIFIMGHSCGTSDRTLLNTLFEHDNCVSIKAFYHQKDIENDNFSDLVRNISRNFNDKAKMRNRLVNKLDSERL